MAIAIRWMIVTVSEPSGRTPADQELVLHKRREFEKACTNRIARYWALKKR